MTRPGCLRSQVRLAEPHPLSHSDRRRRRRGLWRDVSPRDQREGAAARDDADRRDSEGGRSERPRAPRSIEDFLDAIASERNAANNTIEAYRRDLDGLSSISCAVAASTPLGGQRRGHPRLSGRRRRGGARAASTLARRLSAVRQFHKFLYLEGRRGDDPTLSLEGPRRARPLPKVLSVDEVERLIAVAREGLDAPDAPPAERLAIARMACLIELLYATGLRVSELIALPKSAARAREPLIAVRRQGRQGAARAALRAGARRDARLSRAARRTRAGAGGGPWLFPADERERPSVASGFRARPEARRRGRGLAAPRASARTCCATPSPAICCRTAPICASCRICSATPTFRRRRSTPMCSTSAPRRWCAICIRSPTTRTSAVAARRDVRDVMSDAGALIGPCSFVAIVPVLRERARLRAISARRRVLSRALLAHRRARACIS